MVRFTLLTVAIYSICFAARAASTVAGPKDLTPSLSWQEEDFKHTAGELYRRFRSSHSKANHVLGRDITLYGRAVDSTVVQCAPANGVLPELRAENKMAYFVPQANTIYLDCEHYDEFLKSSDQEKNAVIVQEYKRKISIEEEKVSGDGSPYIPPHCYANFFSVGLSCQ